MKAVRILLLLALVMVSLGLSPIAAKAGAFATYTSSIQLQNLDAVDGTISLIFYKADGTIETTVSDTITANGQKVYFPLPTGVGAGFNGSVVVTSTTNVASISNIVGGSASDASAAYVADSSGATTLTLPVLMKANGVFSSWFNVQNAGTGDANVTVTYSDGTTASFAGLKPGAAHTFDNATETHTAKIFAATITSNQPVAATVILESTKIMFAHGGFKAGSTNPVLPLINIQPSKAIQTGVNLANAGDTATTVTVSYTPAAGKGTACTETQAVDPHSYKTFALGVFSSSPNPTGVTSNCVKGSLFVGSAKVTTNSTTQPLAIVVSQLSGTQSGSAYNGFDPASATGTFVVPLAMDRNSATLKLFTTINMMNVSNVATTITCTFTGAGAATPYTSVSLAEGESTVAFQNNAIAAGYVGGATCKANTAGAKIIAVVNEAAEVATTKDLVLTYEAINIP